VWRKSVFDIYFTEFGTALTSMLPILFQYCYTLCYSDSRNLWAHDWIVEWYTFIFKRSAHNFYFYEYGYFEDKGNNKITELWTILQRESQNS
jgi:hypothetical protein